MLHATLVKFQYEENSFCFNLSPKKLLFGLSHKIDLPVQLPAPLNS